VSRAALGLLAWGLGCTQPLVRSADDLGPYMVLSGRLDSALIQSTTEDPATWRGGLAWLVLTDEMLGVTFEPAEIEPRLFGYAMAVTGPPALGSVGDLDVAPTELRFGDTRVALGLPVLHAGPPPAVSRDAMLLWALGTLPDASRVFGAGETRARAAATGHVVATVRSDLDLQTLAHHPDFVSEAPWRRWGGLEPVLALYRDDTEGWRSVGYAEEVQGVDMVGVGPAATTPGP